jgi:2-dehydropantoate 2-reductase
MMRIAVVGAGAIGGFLAGALARAGVPVVVVARGEHAAAIERRGLRVESDLGDFTLRLDVTADLRTLDAAPDYLLLTFKAHQWPGVVDMLAPYSRGSTQIVTMQNGLPFWFVREPPLASVDPGGTIGKLFADSQIVGSVVHVSGNIVAPGHVRQSGGLRYVFGDPNGGCERALELVRLLGDAGLAAEADSDVRATVWLKLVNNVGLNAVSVLRRLTIKPMLENAEAREQVRRLMNEALKVGRTMGVVGDVDVDARIAYAARLDNVKTSMLQDFERHKPLELDPILGAVCELGERYGVATPAVREAYEAVRRSSAVAG